jgi:lipopolysaccharide biosynthesis regulator YciM
MKRILLIITCAVILLGNAVTVNASTAPEYSPVTSTVFNNPRGTKAQQLAIITQIDRSIDAAPAKSTIRMAQYLFDIDSTADKLIAAYKRLSRMDEGLALLRTYLESYPSLDLLNATFQVLLERDGPAAANELVRGELRRYPTLLGLDRMLEAQVLEAPLERRRDLELIRNLVHQHTRSLSLYRCDSCGFKARQFYWHCPACHGWETYPPRRSEERELPG